MSQPQILDGKYEIVSKIKSGRFSVVYYGFDRHIQKPVAIKALHSNLLNEKIYADRFVEEAKNIAKLIHPNIVQIYDLRQTDAGAYYFVLEYIDGLDLETILKRCDLVYKKLPVELSAYIVAEIAKALDYAHNLHDSRTKKPLNVIYGEFSPSNIMISFNGVVKLIDFGLTKSRLSMQQGMKVENRKVKWAYLSPELISGQKDLDRRSDVFSLGLVFFEMLTGTPLFRGDNIYELIEAITRFKTDDLIARLGDLPEDLQNILNKSLKTNRDERYQATRELQKDLSQYLKSRRAWALDEQLRDFVQGINKPLDDLTRQKAVEIRRSENLQPEAGEMEAKLDYRSKSVIFQEGISTEPKTTIDVLRHSTSSNRKALILSFISLLTICLIYISLDFSFKWTSFGKRLYMLAHPASVKIDSLPAGARVFLDGKPLQLKTPLEIPGLAAGVHQLLLTLENYSPVEKSITVLNTGEIKLGTESVDSNQSFIIRFKKEIRIDSIPQGATVYINNKQYPLPTPFSLLVEIGRPFSARMELAGYEPLPEILLDTLEDNPTISAPERWTFTVLSKTNKLYLVKGFFQEK